MGSAPQFVLSSVKVAIADVPPATVDGLTVRVKPMLMI